MDERMALDFVQKVRCYDELRREVELHWADTQAVIEIARREGYTLTPEAWEAIRQQMYEAPMGEPMS